MRNVESSEWLKNPNLSIVESNEDDGVRRSRFNVSANQITIEDQQEAELNAQAAQQEGQQ
jgi:Tfp pilus assembly protein PilN